MTIKSYLKNKSYWEVLFWFVYFAMHIVANSIVASMDASASTPPWAPVTWEASSVIMVAATVPMLLYIDNRYPIRLSNLKQALLWHLVATIPFSLIHVFGMVAIREAVYFYMGGNYDFGQWGKSLFYEYLKDFRSYFGLISIFYLYRFILFRLQGEASLLDKEENALDSNAEKEQAVEHLLVKKLGKEFLIKVENIEWLEACGNYVNLHLSGRAYPYRGTMKSLQDKLDESSFLRVHRSYMVNFQHIKAISPLESGDAMIELVHGGEVPFSRKYRTELKELLA